MTEYWYPHVGPIAMGRRDEHWASVIQELLCHVNHRSLASTKSNAVSALRAVGRLYVGDRVRRAGFIHALRTVIGYMTPGEKLDLLHQYRSPKALSTF